MSVRFSFLLVAYFLTSISLHGFAQEFHPEFDPHCTDPLIVSLGCNCVPAEMMSNYGLRKHAFPFDWGFSNNIRGVIKLIQDDFSHLVEPRYLRHHRHHYEIIVNTYYHFELRHDFPRTDSNQLYVNWREYIPSVKAKYRRRVARFNQLAFYKGKVFFIRVASNSTKIWEIPNRCTAQEAILLCDALRQKFPALDFTLLIVNYSRFATANEKQPWGLEKIENFCIREDQPAEFEKIFQRLGFLRKPRYPDQEDLYERS